MEWYLSDHLGSTTLLINESGLEVERTEYFPYGQVQSGGLEKYGFTGQENDIDTGLMYYGARYYSPEYRIFIQPDTMLPDPYNPQALNRYAYALNNPVKHTDPSGHIPQLAALVGGLILVARVMSVTSIVSDIKAWNNYEISTEKLIANSAFNGLGCIGGGSLKIFGGTTYIQGLSKVYQKDKQMGVAVAIVKGIPATFDDVAVFIAKDGPLALGKYAVDNIGSGIGATIEENTAGRTRLGDTSSSIKASVSNAASSTKTSVSNAASSTKTSVSNAASSTKTSISSATSNISSSISSAASSISSSVSSATSSAKAVVGNTINRLLRK
ncbi:RHS repeat-associated core domain-containing protein [Methanolobus sp. WCC5]|uniref:RHS repeat-associated core domain-containing protein n=1 Tax=Methanolobus sp. WCC5 TaxID=3125785 RepID=UPI00324E6F27